MKALLRTTSSLVAVLVALVLGPGCAAAVSPVQIESARTAARVKTALVNDDLVGVRAIEVRVRDGAVWLSGRVATEEEASRALEVARAVPGVDRVESRLVAGVDPSGRGDPSTRDDAPPAEVAATTQAVAARAVAAAFEELDDERSRLAVGVAGRMLNQRGSAAGAQFRPSPIVRIGAGRGLGPAVAFDWFHARPRAPQGLNGDVGRVQVRPVMAGLRYAVPFGRWSVAPSLVGGYAFNSLDVAEAGAVERLSVGISNSLIARGGVSVWVESGLRTVVHASIGRVISRPQFTVVEDGRLQDRTARIDATIVLVGVAYKLF